MVSLDEKKISAAPWRGKSALVVDDYSAVRKTVKDILAGLEVRVDEAENGLAALEILKSKNFDMIFSDLVMPEMDGFELTEAVKTNPRLRHMPVVIISTHADAKYTFRAFKLGADDYLTKPPSPEMVKVVLGRMFDHDW